MVFKIEQDILIKWKTLYNKSCRSCFIESRTVEFVFFWFFYNFISILQVCCLMHPGPQDLNLIFFLRLGPVAQAGGDKGIVLKFFEMAIYFWNFIFFKYKNEKISGTPAVATCNSVGDQSRHRILWAFRRRGLDLGLWDPLSEPRQWPAWCFVQSFGLTVS